MFNAVKYTFQLGQQQQVVKQGLHARALLLHLLQVKYTQDKGNIRIRWWADDQGAHLSVQDSGMGIDAKHLTGPARVHVFDVIEQRLQITADHCQRCAQFVGDVGDEVRRTTTKKPWKSRHRPTTACVSSCT